ncbi:glycyl-radical enzyme activating protein [Gelria sp. Kuro-4]|uniref:glycyl-radical enzyme activating protein n=1 Tax=Gelria sp. Kuro-4 TaxID=2796927 RepID=UPI001C8133B9|nr:glycyl-radical enzyme activating protein [Gelria sp. Kuro-4]
MRGIVFNIQRFSLHDGPGIRTTVFLKGCPLRCQWCSNPESQTAEPQIMYLERRCLHCGTCSAVCPQGAIVSGTAGQRIIDRRKCTACGLCVNECMAEALRWSGEHKSAREIAEVIERDQPFYRASGGGVTFSGGEPLLQAEFVQEIALLCRERGIPTAIETSGYAPEERIAELMGLIDLWLVDIKHPDEDKHRAYTGVSNAQIISNLRYLAEHQATVVARIPFIGRVNADTETVERTIQLLRSIGGIREVHLLPYHELGVRKYDQLGRTYKTQACTVAAEDVEEALARFHAAGYTARNDGVTPRRTLSRLGLTHYAR